MSKTKEEKQQDKIRDKMENANIPSVLAVPFWTEIKCEICNKLFIAGEEHICKK